MASTATVAHRPRAHRAAKLPAAKSICDIFHPFPPFREPAPGENITWMVSAYRRSAPDPPPRRTQRRSSSSLRAEHKDTIAFVVPRVSDKAEQSAGVRIRKPHAPV